MPFGSFAAFVFPVFFLEKGYVDTPDEHRPERSKPSAERATVSLAFSVQVYNTAGPNHAGCTVYREGRERRDGLFRHGEEHRVYFNPYTRIPNSHGGGYRGPRTHKGVEYGADSEWEGCSDDLAHKSLWFQ